MARRWWSERLRVMPCRLRPPKASPCSPRRAAAWRMQLSAGSRQRSAPRRPPPPKRTRPPVPVAFPSCTYPSGRPRPRRPVPVQPSPPLPAPPRPPTGPLPQGGARRCSPCPRSQAHPPAPPQTSGGPAGAAWEARPQRPLSLVTQRLRIMAGAQARRRWAGAPWWCPRRRKARQQMQAGPQVQRLCIQMQSSRRSRPWRSALLSLSVRTGSSSSRCVTVPPLVRMHYACDSCTL